MSQPFYIPELSELEGRRIDVLCSFELDEKDKSGKKKEGLRWCQGVVVKVLKRTEKPTVMVDWDELSDVEGKAGAAVRGEQVLLPSLWNKDKKGSWRLDVGIEVYGEANDENGSEGIECFNYSEVEVQSESSSSSSDCCEENSDSTDD